MDQCRAPARSQRRLRGGRSRQPGSSADGCRCALRLRRSGARRCAVLAALGDDPPNQRPPAVSTVWNAGMAAASAARADTAVTAPKAGRPSRRRSLRRISCIINGCGIRACCSCRIVGEGGWTSLARSFVGSCSPPPRSVASSVAGQRHGSRATSCSARPTGSSVAACRRVGGLEDVVAACTDGDPRSRRLLHAGSSSTAHFARMPATRSAWLSALVGNRDPAQWDSGLCGSIAHELQEAFRCASPRGARHSSSVDIRVREACQRALDSPREFVGIRGRATSGSISCDSGRPLAITGFPCSRVFKFTSFNGKQLSVLSVGDVRDQARVERLHDDGSSR